MQKPNFFIKYRGVNKDDDSEINLAVLGESIIGFDQVIRDIFRISKMNADISINAKKTGKGSLIIDIFIWICNTSDSAIFEKVADLLNFLRIVDESAWMKASAFFADLKNVHKTINDFARDYPADFTFIVGLIGIFIQKLIEKAGKHKKYPDFDDLPKAYAIAIHKMIKQKKFTKALKPFIENEVTSIEVSHKKDFNGKAINLDNFDSYLGEGEEILPQFLDGKIYPVVGKIVGMQCSRGDSMNIRIKIGAIKFISLIAFPPEGKTTENYRDLFGKEVIIQATIQRNSLYQKPKLFIEEIELQQQMLID